MDFQIVSYWINIIVLLIDWSVGCLVIGTDLWKRMQLNCSNTMELTCYIFSWCTISIHFRESNNMVVSPFPLAIGQLVVKPPSMTISHTNYKKFTWPLLLIRPLRRPLALDRERERERERIVITWFIRCPPTLSVYDVAHSLPLETLDREFPFTEDATRKRFSYLSGMRAIVLCYIESDFCVLYYRILTIIVKYDIQHQYISLYMLAEKLKLAEFCFQWKSLKSFH